MGLLKLTGSFLLLMGVVLAQDYQDYQGPRQAPVRIRPGNGPVENRPTPIAILKQINRHNEDGSYTYGYEGADGSFKIETKLATGEVKGKYGYVDETGKVRIVEYGANKYGFQPSGEGITVAPPTLVDETTNKQGELIADYDDIQPVQQPKPYIARVQQSRPPPPPQPRPQPRPQYVEYEQPQPQPRPHYQQAPSPSRLQIPGALPADVVYSERPRPARPDPEYSQSQTFAAPQQVRLSRPVFQPPQSVRAQSFNPPPRPQPEPIQYSAPQQGPRPGAYASPSAPQGRSTSVLDQLAKDYALPQGGSQPLHDISFGYY